MGNISTVKRGSLTTKYTYDALGQLVRVDDPNDTASGSTGTTWVYSYDRGGNILSKKRYAYTTGTLGSVLQTITYTYGDSNWKDKLTAYNGTAITYDVIGNPTNDATWTYTWENGRQLKQMSKSGTTATFLYNAEGLRIRKTVGSMVTNYTLHGSNLVHMVRGSTALHFFYDAQNRPAIVDYAGTKYAYVYSLQGDVLGLVNSSGTEVVRYVYDAWGRLLATTGTLASTVGAVQPFRYRGYIYDTETGMYYLRSRYYNPTWGRFLNTDTVIEGNLFRYCNNNPVNNLDYNGQATENYMKETMYCSAGCCMNLLDIIKSLFYIDSHPGPVPMITDIPDIEPSYAAWANTQAYNESWINSPYNCYAITSYSYRVSSVSEQLQSCADAVNSEISGCGHVVGTLKHTLFRKYVDELNIPDIRTEVSFLNKMEVQYGQPGSVRFDVVRFSEKIPVQAWDFKTGSAILTQTRISTMLEKINLIIPIDMIK